MSTNPPLLTTRDGPVTTLILNRPEKRNALNRALLDRLCAAVAEAARDPAARVLVLKGGGGAFCAGLDLEEAADSSAARESTELVARALRELRASRLATIAAVDGPAIAGGAGLVAACDFALATADAKFGYPEVRRGLVPAMVMTLLRRQVRERDARELLLRGELVDAHRALEIGLINRVVKDAAALEAEVQSFVHSLLQGAPGAIAATKNLLAELCPVPLEQDLEHARAAHLAQRESAEAREGIAAFREKRRPRWG